MAACHLCNPLVPHWRPPFRLAPPAVLAPAPTFQLQVLFFTPPIRDAMLQHVPDIAAEFSLAGELSFLFRMMAAPGATICQASMGE